MRPELTTDPQVALDLARAGHPVSGIDTDPGNEYGTKDKPVGRTKGKKRPPPANKKYKVTRAVAKAEAARAEAR